MNETATILSKGAAATAAGAGGGGEAVGAGLDFGVFEVVGGDVPKVEGVAVAALEVEHLVEVAVVDFALVTDAEGVAAHEAFEGGGVEVVGEEFEVGVELAAGAEVFG